MDMKNLFKVRARLRNMNVGRFQGEEHVKEEKIEIAKIKVVIKMVRFHLPVGGIFLKVLVHIEETKRSLLAFT